ncbi:hypothetical protein [Azospirillum rugosum]|uniref:Uncharacterized protein n=1 Tax=Azospirillum rugosum TaxID=416170 RepID=A0ABS4SN98_9PROT|nr:hypothetical protein [Azospirillum rugosum]MBP2294029.1 hypothetical protein [Azospirillum rugosum]MDQ0526784.1 hypothetical protein [Azospirillum rugosum]
MPVLATIIGRPVEFLSAARAGPAAQAPAAQAKHKPIATATNPANFASFRRVTVFEHVFIFIGFAGAF